jgi:hypothetical protein
LLVVPDSSDKSRELSLRATNNTPKSFLGVEPCIDVILVTSSFKLSLTLVILRQGRHVPPVTDVDDRVGFYVINQVPEPFITIVVMIRVGVAVWDYEMYGQSETL